jgi:NAD(P)-dependent dehydrogenase (short-subunit alcohol dehydrogenase family)
MTGRLSSFKLRRITIYSRSCDFAAYFCAAFFDQNQADPYRTKIMSRIFITGSADGLGKMAAQLLVAEGYRVVLHARNEKRAADAMSAVPGAEAVVAGDLSSMDATRDVAAQVNRLGHFDAVIHNAGVGYREPRRSETVDGLPHVFAINTVAPYILTALIEKPRRLVYLSSGLHESGTPGLDDLLWEQRAWQGASAYSDSKLHDLWLALGVARRWPEVLSNAVHPGWVPTKMGGTGAPDDIEAAPRTQAWLAVSDDPAASVTGEYFFHMKPRRPSAAARDEHLQDGLIEACERLTGIRLPN